MHLLAVHKVKGTSWVCVTVSTVLTGDLTSSRIVFNSGHNVHQSLLNGCTSSDGVNSHKCRFQFGANKRL